MFANTKHVTCWTLAVRIEGYVSPNVMHICCGFFSFPVGESLVSRHLCLIFFKSAALQEPVQALSY